MEAECALCADDAEGIDPAADTAFFGDKVGDVADRVALVDELREALGGERAAPSKLFADGGAFSVAVSVGGLE